MASAGAHSKDATVVLPRQHRAEVDGIPGTHPDTVLCIGLCKTMLYHIR